MTFLIKNNGNEGLFDEKQNRPPKLKHTSRSLDILLVSIVVMMVLFVIGTNLNISFWVVLPVVAIAMLATNYYMYVAAYRDGFRGGYQTAMDDHDDLGSFAPERMRDHG